MTTPHHRSTIEFLSHGDVVRGDLWRPVAHHGHRLPAVLLTHGWGMTAGGNLADFATAFADAGFVAMTIDFRNLGRSGGATRQDVNPWEQVEDIRNAITYLGARSDVDAHRIGIWGSSFSGGHVIVVAATDPRVRCVVSQVPTIDSRRAAELKLSPVDIRDQQRRFADDRLHVMAGGNPALVRSVSEDPAEPVLYPGADSFAYMRGDGQRSSTWRNETTLRSVEWARAYRPGSYIDQVAPTPLLMIIASNDTVCPTGLQLEAFDTASEPKRLVIIEGGHYTPYVDAFAESSAAACAWFTEHLS